MKAMVARACTALIAVAAACSDPKPAPAGADAAAAPADSGGGSATGDSGSADAAKAVDAEPGDAPAPDAPAADAATADAALPEGQYAKVPTVPLPSVAPRFAIPSTHKAGKWVDPATGASVWVLPNGRWVTPAGDQTFLGAYPLGVAVHPGGKWAYVANSGKAKAVQVVDLATGALIQSVPVGLAYRFMTFSPDQSKLYVSGGPQSPVTRFAIGGDGKLTKDKTYADKYGCYGIAASPDGAALYCAVAYGKVSAGSKAANALWRYDVATGALTAAAGLANVPYDIAMAADGKTVYVMQWLRGTVQRVDTATMAAAGSADTIELGPNGQGLALSADGKTLYASSVDGDFVAIIDTAAWTVTNKITLGLGDVPLIAPQGRDPGLMALSPDGKRVYVACAMSNEIAVIDTATATLAGAIPVGWYPSGVAVTPDGKTVLAVNAKGTGYPEGWKNGSAEDGYLGTLSRIPVPTAAQLATGKLHVTDNLFGTSGVGRIPMPAAAQVALPGVGPSPKIQHVIYIMRENKTFDVQLGDLAGEITGVTADPKLALFGQEFTPNLHKLAKTFCLLDNFYTDGDYSATGHSYATAAKASDYIEKHYLLSEKGAEIAWGLGTSSRPARGYLFQNVLAHGMVAKSYGEAIGMADSFMLTQILQLEYPGIVFNMAVKDRDKALWFADHIKGKDLPHFAFLVVPNNHTCCGGDATHASPKSMIADNDEATGLLVEAISLHKDWTSTVVFIFEDDPQDGGDSVEYHRSPLVVVSPWVKRGQLVKDHHATGAIHATLERALGITPLTELDALASPIYGCFSDGADTTPYQHVPRLYPETLNKDEKKKKWTAKQAKAWQPIGPFSVDDAPGLGRLLWEMYQGAPAPWPRVQYTPFDDD